MLLEPFFDHARRRPTRPFLHGEGGPLSYGEAAEAVAGMARALQHRGVGPGDRVALISANHPDFVLLWFAVLRAGAVFVPLDPRLLPAQHAELLRRASVQLLVLAEGNAAPRWDGATVALSTVRDAAVADLPDDWPDVDDRSPAGVLFTSGTTGLPKGVVLSHRSYAAAGAHLAEILQLTAADRIALCLPLFHANPQFYGIVSAVQRGASVVVLPRFSTSTFWADVAAAEATGFTYVGSVLSLVAAAAGAGPPAPSVRFCVGGGAPLQAWALIEDQLGIAVHELYGMTETGSFATINGDRRRRGSVGTPRPDLDVAILDDDDQLLPPGTAGEIAVRPLAPSVLFDGYDGLPEVTLEAFRNLWFHTGDLGRFDDDGFLYFVGRARHVIRRGGENLAPAEIEAALLEHPAVREVAVVGVEDEILDEEIKAVVVPDGPLDVDDLMAFVADRLPRFMRPRYLELRDALPRTSTQKVQVEALRAQGDHVLRVDPGPRAVDC